MYRCVYMCVCVCVYIYICTYVYGEGNGNPLHCYCPENPMDRRAWWGAVHEVAKSRSQQLSMHTHTYIFFFCQQEKERQLETLNSTIALISHASKEMLKILQARLQQYVNHELPDVQAGFRKDRGTRDQIANIHWIMEKARAFQKNIDFWFID